MLSLKNVVQAWDNFFFKEEQTESIAVFRILWVSLILLYFLFDLGNFKDFYGEHGLISLDTLKDQTPFWFSFLFKVFGAGDTFLLGLTLVYGLSLISALVGYRTKISLLVMLICMTTFHQRNIWFLSSAELLMRVITFLLVFTPCSHSLSVDSYFKGKRQFAPAWGQRLIQIQLSVVYLWTVWHKIKGDTWFEGTAVYYATRLDSLKNFTIPYLMDSLLFLKLTTWGTLIIESALGALLWFKECRKWLVAFGILFHLSIEFLMSIPFFEWLMIVLLLSFVTSQEYVLFFKRIEEIVSHYVKKKPTPTFGVGLKD